MWCPEVQGRLLDRLLGGREAVDVTDDGSLDEHLTTCAACRAEHAEALRALAALPEASLVTPAAPAALRARLLVDTRTGRPVPSFAGGVARLFDLELAVARRLLERAAAGEGWAPGLCDGNRVRAVGCGPRAGASAQGWLLCTEPGVTLPRHRHLGAETTFVLQGGYRDSGGDEVWAGDHAELPADSQHDLLVLPPTPCIAAVLIHGGIVPARR